jgi:hypothetical protein
MSFKKKTVYGATVKRLVLLAVRVLVVLVFSAWPSVAR